jgi:hypothetical protein
MDTFLDILKYILPSTIVFLAVYFVLKKHLDTQLKSQVVAGRQGIQGTVLPIRLQAYERMVLLLERITPQTLVMRVNNNAITSGQLHQELLASIRAEFEHNLTQQVYISKGAWEAVKRSKEETIKIINIAASKVNDNAKGFELSKMVLELSMKMEKMPTQIAIDFIKEEARSFF